MEYENVQCTNEVSLAHINNTIDIEKLSEANTLSNDKLSIIITAKLGNAMNCVGMKVHDITHDVNATLKLYPYKIHIKLDNVKTQEESIRSILDQHIRYRLTRYKDKLTINILEHTKLNIFEFISHLSSDIECKSAKIHATGLKSPESLDYILDNLIPLLKEHKIIEEDTVIQDLYYIMSNCKYNLGFKVALWPLVSQINMISGFEDAFCIYDNLRNAHETIIILPMENHPEITKKIWRTNIEVSFSIKNKGSVNQSSPSSETGRIAYYMLKRAIKQLGTSIIRS